jgi:hypothetical protein
MKKKPRKRFCDELSESLPTATANGLRLAMAKRAWYRRNVILKIGSWEDLSFTPVSDLRKIRNVGAVGIKAIQDELKKRGLDFVAV